LMPVCGDLPIAGQKVIVAEIESELLFRRGDVGLRIGRCGEEQTQPQREERRYVPKSRYHRNPSSDASVLALTERAMSPLRTDITAVFICMNRSFEENRDVAQTGQLRFLHKSVFYRSGGA